MALFRLRSKRLLGGFNGLKRLYSSGSIATEKQNVLELHAKLELDCNNVLGECTIWDDRTNMLCWIDCEDCKFFNYDPLTKDCTIYDLPEKVGSFALCEDGSYLFAFENGPCFYDPKTNTILKRIFEWPSKPNDICPTRPNDGRVDRQGRFVFGGMQLTPHSVDTFQFCSNVYRINHDLSYQKLTTLTSDRLIGCTNSICFNLDGDAMYFSDTFDIENGSNIKKFKYYDDHRLPVYQERFVNFDNLEEDGFTDGSIVDNDDAVWNARLHSGQIYRFDNNGTLNVIVHVPEPQVACVTIGGEHLDTLYINCIGMDISQEEMEQNGYNNVGGLWSVKLPETIKGRVENRFLGSYH